MERLQFPVANADVMLDYTLQGQTVPGIMLDMLRPPRMSRDEHWLSMLVFVSRAETLENVKVLRLCEKKDLEGGPPQFLLQEIDRVKLLEENTIQRLDQKLLNLELHGLRATTTAKIKTMMPSLNHDFFI